MRRSILTVFVLAAIAAFPGAVSAATLVPLAPPSSWSSSPIHAASPPGDPRLFLVERAGTVRLIKGGVLQPTPFLTVPNVETGGERGLLSIAFPPDYASSGLSYVFTVAKAADSFGGSLGDLRILEYERSAANPDVADPASARLVFALAHSADSHNGGQLAFGPDGLLYVTIGDNVNGANSQDLANLYGKVLRIDPSPAGGIGYDIPPSNPFVGTPGARGEIYALGLRNPFRASFAPDDSLVIPDVGQSSWEEVNAGNLAGANLGWPTCEGVCLSPQPAFTDPVFQYPHGPRPGTTSGCAIIGGLVVRDPALTSLAGRYLYGDLCRSDLRTLNLAVPAADPRPSGLSLPDPDEIPLSFGEDGSGHVYVMTDRNAYAIVADASERPPSGGGGARDEIVPQLGLRASKQRLRGYVEVLATCSEPCALSARGTIGFPAMISKRVSAKLRGASGSAQAGVRTQLKLRLRPKLRKRAARALRTGRKVSAKVTVSAADSVGNATRDTVRVRLTL